jgi:hypothetical protein
MVQKNTLDLPGKLPFCALAGAFLLQKLDLNVFCQYFSVFKRFGTKRALFAGRIVVEARQTHLFEDDS